jgi:lysophospholipase L1-like esterase
MRWRLRKGASGASVKTILCFGDSNTWGSATSARPDDRYHPEERWPNVLASELGSAWSVVAEGLSGRTTVHPDPIEGRWLDGSAYLLPCLKSHKPLDAVAVMLGTNDLKARFSVPAGDIARGVGVLLQIIKTSQAGRSGGAPKALVISPPPIAESFGERTDLAEMFLGGREKSLRLADAYQTVAREHGAAFFDAGTVIRSSAFDGIHLDKDAQVTLGRAVAETLRKLGW